MQGVFPAFINNIQCIPLSKKLNINKNVQRSNNKNLLN